jgi:hypothetical protein
MYGELEINRNLQGMCQGSAVSRRHLTAEALARFWTNVYGVCGGKSDTGAY